MEQLTAFLQDRWLMVVVAVVVLLLVIKIVKTVIKWVIVLAIVAFLIYSGATYTDKLKEVGGSVLSSAKEAADSMKDEAIKQLSARDAKYQANADGTFVVTAAGVKLEGKLGSEDVKITVAGKSFTVKADDAIKAVIEASKKNG